MARLVEAVRPEARLVLVGDPGQLSSIEAGAVLGDIVGDGGSGRESIVVLDRVHRYGRGIDALASAVRGGDGDRVVEVLEQAPPGVTWLRAEADPAAGGAPELVRERAVATARAVFEAAAAGRVHDALAALGSFRLLCAHRHGPYGVDTWMPLIEGWLAAEVEGLAPEPRWYVGRPLLVTENDYGLRLYNGDTGVVVATGENRLSAAFERRGEVLEVSPSRLDKVETVYAMTIHKSQGSQFGTAAVVLPDPSSRLLTRELLYTAITRARQELIVVGGEASIRAAVARPVARASGLGRLLWG
jgi:exodeoxyribonuclease V alpha subunit